MSASDELRQNDMTDILRQLKDIATAVIAAAEADTLGEVLERIAETARQMVRARYAALGVPDNRGGLEFFMFSGLDDITAHKIGALPQGRGLLGAIMAEREPIRIPHISQDPRSVGFPPHHPLMDRFLGVPILVGDQLFGMLYLTDPEHGREFDERDQWLIEMLAGYAALAIAGARLRDQRARLTLFEERERISMELHDGVIQSLYAIGMQIELMRVSGSIEADDLRPVMQSLNKVIEDIREYILNLKAAGRQQKTISQCIHETLKRLHIPADLTVTIQVDEPDVPLSPLIAEAVSQMANEAISNVVRHASAHKVIIKAQRHDRLFELEIIDDGAGFDMRSIANHAGLGLFNIQQRARLHGGTVNIHSKPGAGTNVTLLMPLHN
ncbi:MAG: GAF domain-containing sensor histidine kinase [Aggregatilineales bacterium]